jgi:hypothetical protein
LSAHFEQGAFVAAMSCSCFGPPSGEAPFGKLVFGSSQQRLLCRLSSSQSVDSNASSVEIHLSSDQPMRPVSIHKEAVSEQSHYPFLAGAPQIDDSSARVNLKIELPRLWERGPVSTGSGLTLYTIFTLRSGNAGSDQSQF